MIRDTVIAENKEILDKLPDGTAIFIYDGDTLDVIHLNRRYWELVGRASVAYKDALFINAVHENDRAAIRQELIAAIRESRNFSCDARILYGEESYRPFHIAARIFAQEDGKHLIYAAFTPISDETMSFQRMLPLALAAVIGSSSDMMFIKDRSLHYVCCNRIFAQAIGMDDESEIIGKTDYDLTAAEFADRYSAEDTRIIESKKAQLDYEAVIPNDKIALRFCSTSKYPLLDSAGEVVGLLGVIRDVTKAREKDSQLKLLTDNIPGGIATYACTPGGMDEEHVKITYFNEGFSKLVGFTREEFGGLSALDLVNGIFEEDRPILEEQLAALLENGTPIDCVYRVHVKDGGYKWIKHRGELIGRQGGIQMLNAVMTDITELQEAAEKLRISEEENRLAIRHSGNTICRFDIAERTLSMAKEVADKFGVTDKLYDVPYAQVRDGALAPESEKVYIDFFEAIIRGGASGEATYQYKTPGGWRWKEAHYSTVYARSGKPVFAVVSFFDVTEQQEKEAVYQKWQQSLREKKPEDYSLFRCNLSKNALFDTVEGSLLKIEFKPDMLTFDERTKVFVRKCVYKEDQEKYLSFMNSDALLAGYYRGKRSEKVDFREKLPDGSIRWLRLTIELIQYPNSTDVAVYLMYENIDDSKKEELETKERAQNDPLTGLLNRKTFEEKMGRILAARDEDSYYALLMLDLDGFKAVNDSFGHAIGDQTLIEIGEKLQSIFRSYDLVCRLGGDEFVVCLCDVPNQTVIAQKAKQICAIAQKSFSEEVILSASVGVAVIPDDGEDFETLYHKADQALYYVKEGGKNSFVFYKEGMGKGREQLAAYDKEETTVCASHGKPKRRMLIVEDNKMSRELLANVFKDEFVIDTADDGSSALTKLRRYSGSISVVLLDLLMPDVDGFTVLNIMRESPQLQTIPVIVVSSMDEHETALKAIRSGASDFVTKPVDSELLRLRVQSAIGKSENERLRAQNRYLLIQNDEVESCRAVLESSGITLAQYDAASGTFTYDKSIALHIAGSYDERSLWEIFSKDKVAAPEELEVLRKLVADVSASRARNAEGMQMTLRTPSGILRNFDVKVIKRIDEYDNGDKLVLAFSEA